MSDFDREAEREKLREQFAEDERKRETTERMSELLLQGATMTNKHCDTCGDPIFRHEGQEFCPTCQGGGAAESAGAQQEPAGAQQEPAEPDQAATADPAERDAVADRAGAATRPDRAARAVDGAEQPATAQQSSGDGGADARAVPAGTGDLAEARAALSRTVTRLARQAETSEDLGRTREYLAAAKEAAEALRAVKQADR